MRDLEFVLKPSIYYQTILIMFVVASFCIAISLSISLLMKCVTLFFVSFYGCILIWHFGLLKASDSIVRLRRLSNGDWQVQSNQRVYEATLKGDSTVTTVVSILRFQAENKRFPITCVIFPDSLLSGVYRQLLVAVRS
jgi:hypothetical protein